MSLRTNRVALLLVALIAVVGLGVLLSPQSGPQGALRDGGRGMAGAVPPSGQGAVVEGPFVGHSVHNDTSPPLRDMTPLTDPVSRIERDEERRVDASKLRSIQETDLALQTYMGAVAMPTPIISFVGLSNPQACGAGCAPPDPSGDVGPNHYVQMVNVSFQIWNKSGVSLYGPVHFNTIFQGFGGTCQSANDGDPIVLYDQLADRWLLSQFASGSPNYECIAISMTGDPTGSYHRYAFATPEFPDYPKFGVWPDAYYMASNESRAGNYAFDRTKMLQGLPATYVYFQNLTDNWAGLVPSDVDGTTPPPAGSPNYIIGHRDNQYDPAFTQDVLKIFEFHVDFAVPGNSTYTLAAQLPVTPYDGIVCPGLTFSCIRQPGTTQRLDAVAEWGMHRFAYRNFGTHESAVFNHTVDRTGLDQGEGAVRWYELRNLNSTPTIHQQSTFAPDILARWMGSMAMDRQGNIAVGYSVGGSTLQPGLRYAGRLATDPLNELTQGESSLHEGGGVQTGSNRWGDYSQLTVDPTDDCTFWYTGEYYETTSSSSWRTRIGSFRFPGCTGGGTPTLTATPGGPTQTPVATQTSVATQTRTATQTVPVPSSTSTTLATSTLPATATRTATGPATWTATRTATVPASSTATVAVPTMTAAATGTPIACCGQFTIGVLAACSAGTGGQTFYATVEINNPCPMPVDVTSFVTLRVSPDGSNWTTWASSPERTFTVASGPPPTSQNEFFLDQQIPAQHNFYHFISTVREVSGCREYFTASSTQPICRTGGTITPTSVAASVTTTAVPSTAVPSPTACTVQFTDVQSGDTFYTSIRCLACRGILGGYSDGTFRPNNDITRGQLSKVVSNSAGWSDTPPGQQFEDVPTSETFYLYIERLASRGHIGGYPCGGPGEPCGTGNRPYFRPNAPATRGQISKIVSNAAGFSEPVTGQRFQDVSPANAFYLYIERLAARGVMTGYACGGPGEPCVGPNNRPYFRPNTNATRGQTSKIVANTFFPGCESSPASTATVTACGNIPPAQDMTIQPSNCATAGTTFTFVGAGFSPGETVSIYVTTPDGSVFGAAYQITADGQGSTPPVTFNTSTTFPLGVWTMTMGGVTSQHRADGPFRLRAP